MKLSVELEKWRADRPDEWKMDEFIRNAAKLEEQTAALAAQVLKLEKRIKAINEGVEEYKSMCNDATADLVHKALMSVREEIIQRDLYQSAPDFIEQFANQYAEQIRKGEGK